MLSSKQQGSSIKPNMGMNIGIHKKSLEYLNKMNNEQMMKAESGNGSRLLNKQEKNEILSSYYTAKKKYATGHQKV